MISIKYLIKKFRDTKFGLWLENSLLSYIAAFIIKLISYTIKIKKVGYEQVEDLFRQKKNVIYTFFHGEQFLLIFVHRKENIVIMSSLSRDGELQTKILTKFGFDIVRGSTKKGFVSSTKSILEKFAKVGRQFEVIKGGTHKGKKIKLNSLNRFYPRRMVSRFVLGTQRWMKNLFWTKK